jgi:hypothetical protein
MPYSVVIWRRGSNIVDIAGLKPEDLKYLENIPCLSTRVEVDSEGFIRFGPSNASKYNPVKPTVVLSGLEVLGFKVVTTTACRSDNGLTTEYSWTLRREFSVPEPQE